MRSFHVVFVVVFVVVCALPAGSSAATTDDKLQAVHCRSADDFVAALSDPRVGVVVVLDHLTLADGQFKENITLERNVTVTGGFVDQTMWPEIDLGFVNSKIQLIPGHSLTITRVVLSRWRRGPHFQAPGIDIIATSGHPSQTAPAPAWAHLIIYDMVWVSRGCLEPSLASAVAKTAIRPPFVAGPQLISVNVSQAGCSSDPNASAGVRCRPMANFYNDLVLFGTNLKEDKTPVLAGYVLWLSRTLVLCEAVITQACFDKLGSLGCFYSVIPDSVQSSSPGSRLQGQPPPLPTAPLPTPSEGGRSLSSSALGGVIAGVVAGVGAVVLLAGVVLFRWHRRAGRGGGEPAVPAIIKGCCPSVANWRRAPSERSQKYPQLAKAQVFSEAATHDSAEMTPAHVRERTAEDRTDSCPPEYVLEPVTHRTPRHASVNLQAKCRMNNYRASSSDSSDAHSGPGGACGGSQPSGSGGGGGDKGRRQSEKCDIGRRDDEVTLLPNVIGKGAFGRVVEGLYGGQRVAVKLLNHGLLAAAYEGGPCQQQQQQLGSGTQPPPASGNAMMRMSVALPSAAIATDMSTGVPPGGLGALGRRVGPDVRPGLQAERRGGGAGGAAVEQPAPVQHAMVCTEGPEGAAGPQAHAAPRHGGEGDAAAGVATAAAPVPAGDAGMPPEGLLDVPAPAALAPLAKPATVRLDSTASCSILKKGGVRGHGSAAADKPEIGVGQGSETAAASIALALERDVGSSDTGAEPHNALERSLAQEVEVLARLQHPNIVRLLAACLRPPNMCLVMELMETSLERMLHSRGPEVMELMPLDKVLHIAAHVANGLAYLHPTVIHRDLKPANILLSNAASPTPTVKLADFGLSKLQTTIRLTLNVEAGTVPYMAPETLDIGNYIVTHHVDVYALGVLLYEMLSGLRPWAGHSLVQVALAVNVKGQRPPLDLVGPQRCPVHLRTLIHQCWEHEPRRRPAASEVVKKLILLRLQLLQRQQQQQPQRQEQEQRQQQQQVPPSIAPCSAPTPRAPVAALPAAEPTPEALPPHPVGAFIARLSSSESEDQGVTLAGGEVFPQAAAAQSGSLSAAGLLPVWAPPVPPVVAAGALLGPGPGGK